MSDDQDRSEKPPGTGITYDASWRLTAICEGGTSEGGNRGITTFTYAYVKHKVAVEHDLEKRVYRLTGPDGKTEVFRDDVRRFLVVEPDRETGRMIPVIREGEPRILCLCREERE